MTRSWLRAEKGTKGAWYRQWRLVSLDGSTLDVADTAVNAKAFGRPGASRGSSAFPKIRFVALLNNRTHLWPRTWQIRYRRTDAGQECGSALRKGMLCMADRFFPSYKLWRGGGDECRFALAHAPQCPSGGGKTLTRWILPEPHDASTSDRRKGRKGIVVRVIDYRLRIQRRRSHLPAHHYHTGSREGPGPGVGGAVS